MSAIALIPGAGGNAWYWNRVVPGLRVRGHDGVAVDLPADDDRAGLEEYADAVVQAIRDRTDIALVAQSMGAYTAGVVATRLPVSAIVLVNPMIPRAGESAGAWWAATGQGAAMEEHARSIGLPGLSLDDAENLFGHDVPADVWAESANHLRGQSGTPFGEPWPVAVWPSVPTHVIVSRDDRLFPLEFARRVARERLGVEAEEIDGGHLVALSRPQELADRIAMLIEAPLAVR